MESLREELVRRRGLGQRAELEKRRELASAAPKQPIDATVFNNMFSGPVEAAASVATGTVGEVAGGLTGLATLGVTGDEQAAVHVQNETRDALTFQPRGQAGKGVLESLGTVLAPIGEAVEGARKATGDAAFESTGSPEVAALTSALPDAALMAIPFLGSTLRNTKNLVLQSRRAKIGEKLKEGIVDNDTAGFKLDPIDESIPRKNIPDDVLSDSIIKGAPKVVKDKLAKETLRQGFDEGVVAAIKGSSDADIDSMLKMVNSLDKGRKNARFAATNRPSDIVGKSLKSRIVSIKRTNKVAGKRLDVVANDLKGQPVNITNSVDSFLDELKSMGISFSNDAKLGFKGSDIEGLRGPQAVLNNIVKRMRETKVPDAFDIHRMKKFIDEQVTFGKDQRGLSGKTENILKSLRHNLDGALDDAFPTYKKVNETYSDTIGALDSFQDVAGKKMDLLGPNADKAIGTLSRRLLSNAQSRIALLDAIDEITSVATKYGAKVNDDIITQVMFIDELGSVFGPSAKTSLQGDMAKAARSASEGSVTRAALDAAIGSADKLRGINKDAALIAIRKLLIEQRKSRRQGKQAAQPGTQIVPR